MIIKLSFPEYGCITGCDLYNSLIININRGAGGTIHVSNSGYMENDAMCPERTYILSGVFGRPEKGRRAEESVPQLRTDTGKPFVGEFSIMLKAVR